MDVALMSLDEIIQKKKTKSSGYRRVSNKIVKNGTINGSNQRKTFTPNRQKPSNILDARNKIIEKNRRKIRDARDKLVQIARRSGDVRLKLMKKMQNNRSNHQQKSINIVKNKRKPSYPPPPQQQQQQQQFHHPHQQIYLSDDDLLMDIDDREYMAQQSIVLRRTVKNDIALAKMPPLPTFSSRVDHHHVLQQRRESPVMWSSDPFDCYEVPVGRPADVSEPKHLHRQVRNMNAEILPRKGILRNPRDKSLSPVASYTPDENSSLSYEMRNRLERPPDTNASMGIFSNPYIPKPVANKGYRIVVSNLHSSVSQSDIKELFEDIGQLMEARLVRPGVAEVIFETIKDAETAVETYHNRQLDGQPMKCLLVHPRSANKTHHITASSSSASASASASASSAATAIPSRSSRTPKNTSKSSLEIDIDALHKVLFRRK